MRIAGVFAVVYFLIGVVFPNPPASDSTQFAWRLAAWVLFAGAFALHIGIEHFKFRNTPRTTALHAGAGMALGAFAIAVAANVHAYRFGTGNRASIALALVIWPLMSGLPAFAVAWVSATVLNKLQRK
jgi:hypothetical protein